MEKGDPSPPRRPINDDNEEEDHEESRPLTKLEKKKSSSQQKQQLKSKKKSASEDGDDNEEEDGEDIAEPGMSDDDDEEDEENEELTEADKKFIVDDEEEGGDGDGGDDDAATQDRSSSKRRKKRKRRIEEDDEDDLDEEDLALLEENYGFTTSTEKKWKKLRKKTDDPSSTSTFSSITKSSSKKSRGGAGNDLAAMFEDDDEEDDEGGREDGTVDGDEDGDEEGGVRGGRASSTAAADKSKSSAAVARREAFFDLEDDEDDLEDFIIQDEEDGQDELLTQAERLARRKEKKKKVRNIGETYGISDDAWRDIEDIFGDGSDYAFALQEMNLGGGVDRYGDYVDDDDDKMNRKKEVKLTDLYEPAEIARRLLTEEDEVIRMKDLPERFQVLGDLAPYDDAHFDTQARFITRIILPDKDNIASGAKVFEIIKKVLRFLQKDGFEVPFIYAHRKDYFAEVMDLRDLWRIYDLARQWWSVRNAKLRVEGVIRDLQSGVVGDVGMSLEEQSYLEEYLKVAEEIENINDVYEMLQTKYSDFIIMLEEKRSSGGGGVNSNEKVFKRPQRKKLYEEARKRGLGEVAARFGINIRGFVDALMNRQVDSHYPEDYPLSPLPYAENFLSADFSTPEAALDAARQIVAHEIAVDPKLKLFVRNVYLSDAVITVTPTAKGINELEPHHPYYQFKYLKEKPAFKFDDGQFLQILAAEAEGLVVIQARIDAEEAFKADVLKCIVNDFASDNAKLWNEQRQMIANYALDKILFPSMTKWIKERLGGKASEFVIAQCSKSLAQEVEMAPFERDYQSQSGDDDNKHVTIMGLSWGEGERSMPCYGAVINEFGELVDNIKLDRMQDSNIEAKMADHDSLVQFVKRHKVDLIVISGWSINTKTRLFEDVSRIMADRMRGGIQVQLIDDDVARIYMDSKRAIKEFPEKFVRSSLVRYCVSIARRAQDPTMEIAGLCNLDDDIKLLRLHPLQKLVADEKMKAGIERTFLNAVFLCGVDVNLAAMHTHKAHTLQFVSGLGPRKAQAMITKINQLGGKLESRASLIKERICGSQIFMNASSFLRIRRYHFIQKGDEMWDVLDDTRIHPEDYDLARKMAADAIEVEEPLEEDENPSLYVQDLMDGDRDKLDLLLLDDYAIELEKSLNEPKRITLNEIKNELKNPYRERRQRFHPPTIDRIFSMFTHETDTTLYPNMIVACRVIRVLERLVKVALNSGLDGLIHIKNMDAGDVATVAELGFYEDQVLKCRVLNVVKDRFMVELSVKQDDVYGRGSGAAVIKDKYFCNDWEHADLAQKEAELRKQRSKNIISINHPDFQNVDYRQAQEVLRDRPAGSYIIRPSTKGPRNLSITWKVATDIFQHIDVTVEDGMRSFMVDNQRFSELDELLILFIEPMARNVKEIMGTAPKYQNRDLNSMFQFISEQQKSQQKSSYGFILVPEKPGRFFFVYQHVGAPKPKHEYIVIRPDGFLFRDRTFSRIEDLIGGWKQMESQKMQQQRQMQKASSHQQQQGGPQMHPSRQNMLNGSGGRGGPPMHSQHHHDRRR